MTNEGVCLLFHSADTFVTQPPVRLVGGPTTYEGRVEVYLQGQWSTVCDDFWDSRDAGVVCRQLGLSPNGAVALTNAYYGQGTGPILLDNVMCTGEELYLTSCPNNGLYVHDCVHAEDAGVRCQGEGGGGGKREGRRWEEGGEERGKREGRRWVEGGEEVGRGRGGGGKREGRRWEEGGEEVGRGRGGGGKREGRRWEEGGEEVGRGRGGGGKREGRVEGAKGCERAGGNRGGAEKMIVVCAWGCASAFQEMFRGVYGFCNLLQYMLYMYM